MAEKLVLIVVDAMHPGMLRQAMEAGEAPTFAALAAADQCHPLGRQPQP